MAREKIETRLYHESGLAQGAEVDLTRDQAHFLRAVLRLAPGAHLALFNADEGEWTARLVTLGKAAATAEILIRRRAPGSEARADLWLVCAPIKKTRFDFLVEKATELGVARLIPVLTERSQVGRVKTDRLRAQVREATEQCERLSLPSVSEVVGLGELLSTWPAERRLLLCVERGAAEPLGAVLSRAVGGNQGPWAVMIGPEGGYAQSELDALSNLPFVTRVGLGPRVLRAETAALAALCVWQAFLGDAKDRPADAAEAGLDLSSS